MKNIDTIEKLLIVVDMVKGFVDEGNMADRYIGHITEGIENKVKEYIANGDGVMFFNDTHSVDCAEFKKFPPHCIAGTSESELVDELMPYQYDGILYRKNSTSSMFAEGFMEDIDSMSELKEVTITGCCSDICVVNLAIPLSCYFDQQDREVKINVPVNLIETYDAPYHPRDEYNAIAVKLMNQAGINTEEM